MPTTHLTPEILAEIVRIGRDRQPSEACGVLLSTPRFRTIESQVVELPNRSKNHHNSYILESSDIAVELSEWSKRVPIEELNRIAIWHTHPNGSIGPSKGDLEHRLPGIAYLVVAIDSEGRGIPSWF